MLSAEGEQRKTHLFHESLAMLPVLLTSFRSRTGRSCARRACGPASTERLAQPTQQDAAAARCQAYFGRTLELFGQQRQAGSKAASQARTSGRSAAGGALGIDQAFVLCYGVGVPIGGLVPVGGGGD